MKKYSYPSLKDIVEKSLNARYIFGTFGESTFSKDAFLFIIGLYQEAKLRMRGYLEMVYSNPSEGRFYNELFQNVFEELPSDRPRPTQKKPNRRRIIFNRDQVTEVVKYLTGNNEHPPYILLDSRTRMLLYLRGFLFRGLNVTHSNDHSSTKIYSRKRPKAILRYPQEKSGLVHKIQKLLGENFDINSVDFENGFGIFDLASLKKLIDLNLVRYKVGKKLQELLKGMERCSNQPAPQGFRNHQT
ncbi:MAG: hypothetical protein AABX08_03640 [Nanoarchaeota archaeon]